MGINNDDDDNDVKKENMEMEIVIEPWHHTGKKEHQVDMSLSRN